MLQRIVQRLVCRHLRGTRNTYWLSTANPQPGAAQFIPASVTPMISFSCRSLSSSYPCTAGHSHWKNVKGTKEARDGQRASLMSWLVTQMRFAVREHGSADPKQNHQLAKLLQYGRDNNLPKERIDTVLHNMANSKKKTDVVLLEAKGPAGSMMILELFTDNPARTKLEIRILFKKFPYGSLVEGGGIMYNFDLKGVLTAIHPVGSGKPVDIDKAEEDAIEAGAEEVFQTSEEGETKFVCDAMELQKVAKELEKRKYVVVSTAREYLPKHPIVLDDEPQEVLNEFVKKLEENADVTNIYLNCG